MAVQLVQIKKRTTVKTASAYQLNNLDINSLYPGVVDMRDMYYHNIHDWISRRFYSMKPKLNIMFWMSFGVFVWTMSSIVLPLVLSK